MTSTTHIEAAEPNLHDRIMDISGSTLQVARNSNPVESSVEYWTDLVRINLRTAQSLQEVESDSEDHERLLISEEIANAPRRKSARDALAKEIAARLYPGFEPGSLASIIKYEKDVVLLRSIILDQRRSAKDKATQGNARHNWTKRIAAQGPWHETEDPLSLDGTPSLPMPVEVSSRESLAPFIVHLRNGGTHEPSSSTWYSTCGSVATGVEPYYGVELMEFE